MEVKHQQVRLEQQKLKEQQEKQKEAEKASKAIADAAAKVERAAKAAKAAAEKAERAAKAAAAKAEKEAAAARQKAVVAAVIEEANRKRKDSPDDDFFDESDLYAAPVKPKKPRKQPGRWVYAGPPIVKPVEKKKWRKEVMTRDQFLEQKTKDLMKPRRSRWRVSMKELDAICAPPDATFTYYHKD
jgi:DNA repair exonuclease SbcCD ATPase subunit